MLEKKPEKINSLDDFKTIFGAKKLSDKKEDIDKMVKSLTLDEKYDLLAFAAGLKDLDMLRHLLTECKLIPNAYTIVELFNNKDAKKKSESELLNLILEHKIEFTPELTHVLITRLNHIEGVEKGDIAKQLLAHPNTQMHTMIPLQICDIYKQYRNTDGHNGDVNDVVLRRYSLLLIYGAQVDIGMAYESFGENSQFTKVTALMNALRSNGSSVLGGLPRAATIGSQLMWKSRSSIKVKSNQGADYKLEIDEVLLGLIYSQHLAYYLYARDCTERMNQELTHENIRHNLLFMTEDIMTRGSFRVAENTYDQTAFKTTHKRLYKVWCEFMHNLESPVSRALVEQKEDMFLKLFNSVCNDDLKEVSKIVSDDKNDVRDQIRSRTVYGRYLLSHAIDRNCSKEVIDMLWQSDASKISIDEFEQLYHNTTIRSRLEELSLEMITLCRAKERIASEPLDSYKEKLDGALGVLGSYYKLCLLHHSIQLGNVDYFHYLSEKVKPTHQVLDCAIQSFMRTPSPIVSSVLNSNAPWSESAMKFVETGFRAQKSYAYRMAYMMVSHKYSPIQDINGPKVLEHSNRLAWFLLRPEVKIARDCATWVADLLLKKGTTALASIYSQCKESRDRKVSIHSAYKALNITDKKFDKKLYSYCSSTWLAEVHSVDITALLIAIDQLIVLDKERSSYNLRSALQSVPEILQSKKFEAPEGRKADIIIVKGESKPLGQCYLEETVSRIKSWSYNAIIEDDFLPSQYILR